jgi:hypothetical protein
MLRNEVLEPITYVLAYPTVFLIIAIPHRLRPIIMIQFTRRGIFSEFWQQQPCRPQIGVTALSSLLEQTP